MKFVDNYGHIFTMQSHDQFPFGYEYEESDYIFWINKDYQNHLSINNYYSKVINILVPVNEDETFDNTYNIKLNINSNNFSLLDSNEIYNKCNNLTHINDYIELEDISKKELSNENLFCIKVTENNKNYFLIPLYIICISKEEGSWYTNVLISLENKNTKTLEYTYFTIGGEFIDEYEELIINGKNMGINLPKDIIRAVYQGSYYNSEFNTDLYNQKLKEYLLNYMGIRGELGNFNSLENSIKWFGWGDNITISKLLQTDNQFKNQFIRDYFNINNDILDSFYLFRNSTYVSLTVNLYKENGTLNDYTIINQEKINNEDYLIWEEGHPKKESLLDKQVKYTEDNGIEYIKGYFDYNFTELGLKLACFKLFLKQYFLPIHLSILSMSLNERVYMDDIKFDCYDKSTNIAYPIIESYDKIKSNVYFNKDNSLYIQRLTTIVDSNFNDFNNDSNKELFDFYAINNEVGIQLPIYFNNDEDKQDKIYNCSLLLSKEGDKDEYGYYIDINYLININDDIEIYDYNLNKLNNDDLSVCYSYDSKIYSPYYKGVKYLYDIITKMNKYTCSFRFNCLIESNTTTGIDNTSSDASIYKYIVHSITFIEQDNGDRIKYLSIPVDDILDVNKTYYKYQNKIVYIDSNTRKNIIDIINNNFEYDYENKKYYYIVNSITSTTTSINKKEIVERRYIDIKDFIELPIINNFYIRIKYHTDKIGIVKINSLHLNEYLPYYTNIYLLTEKGKNKEIDNKFYWLNTGSFFMHETGKAIFILEESKGYKNFNKDLVSIKFLPTNTLLFESSFIFYENELYKDKNGKKYFNFVICPKYIVNSVDESMWINNKFRLDICVNGLWHNYNFYTKIAEPNISMGKLEYVYNHENSNYIKTSYFSQLSELTDDKIIFNTYSNINNLSLIEHNNFYEDYIKYYTNSNLKYLDGTKFIKENFYYSISYNNTYIYIDEFTKTQDFFIYSPSNKLNSDKYNYCYLTAIKNSGDVSYVSYTYDMLQFNNINNDIYSVENISNNDDHIRFYLDKSKNKYYTYITNEDNNTTYTYYDIISNINYNLDNTFLEKYKEEYNLVNNKKYYNNILLFDIYKEEYEYADKYILTNNSSNIYYKNNDAIGKFVFNNYEYTNDKIISYIEYYAYASNYKQSLNTYKFSYTEDNICDINTISGLYLYNNEYYNRNFYTIQETDTPDTYFALSYNSYNINDVFVINGNIDSTYGRYNITYNNDEKTYVYSYSYYKILECNYSYNNIKFNGNGLGSFIKNITDIVNNKQELLFDEDTHYILLSSYNSGDNSIKDKFYIAYINSLGISYIEKNINTINGSKEKDLLNTFISYDYLDIQNLYFKTEFYSTYNGVTKKIYNPNYNELYTLYEEYYSATPTVTSTATPIVQSSYFIQYKFTKNIYNKYPNNFVVETNTNKPFENKLYNDKILKINNSYYIDDNRENDTFVNNFYIRNINLLDYFTDEELENDCCVIKFKLNISSLNNESSSIVKKSHMNIDITYNYDVYDIKVENNGDVIDDTTTPLYTTPTPSNTPIATLSLLTVSNTYDISNESIDNKKTIRFNVLSNYNNNNYVEIYIKRISNISQPIITRTVTKKPSENISSTTTITTTLIDKTTPIPNYTTTSTSSTSSTTSTVSPNTNRRDINMNISFSIIQEGNYEGKYIIEPVIQTKTKVLNKLKYIPDDSANNKYSFYLGGNNYAFDDNTSYNNVSLYNKFFAKTVKEDLLNKVNKQDIVIIEENDKVKIDKYDFYLMHDFDYWYGIYISKDTIDKFNFSELNKKYDDIKEEGFDYILKYYSSSQQILPNRLKLIDSNGNNIFNSDDIIVIQNKNKNLPINIFNKSKWEANPLSLTVNDYKNESNSDIFIMSMDNNTSNYYRGYYDIILRYNIENYSQQQFLKTTKLLIK